MAEPDPSVEPALLVIAAFSRHMEAIEWASRELESQFGPIAFQSFPYRFNQTTYYEPAMGPELSKMLLAFSDLASLDQLADTKLATNAIEAQIAGSRRYSEPRPVNLDPGLLTLGKFMLATTKDQSHRIYLGKRIFAEVTLRFRFGAFEPWPWTYADYRQQQVLDFLAHARHFYAAKRVSAHR
jgi:Domain of unknown function (DUF4416)